MSRAGIATVLVWAWPLLAHAQTSPPPPPRGQDVAPLPERTAPNPPPVPPAPATATAQTSDPDTPGSAAPPSSPVVASASRFLDEARISGFAQVDYLRRDISLDELSDGTGEPLNEDRFLVRHARIAVDRDWRYVGIASLTELFSDGSTARPVAFDVHAQLPSRDPSEPPLIQVRAGLFAVPFGYESYEQSDTERFFGERSLFAFGLVPGRFDLGAALSGQLYGVDWIVAVQNGEPLESGEFSYDDPNSDKDIAGRVRVSGALPGGVRAAVATSLLVGTGFSPGTPPTKDTFEWRDLNEDGRVLPSELIPIPGSAGRASENFDRWGIGGDAQLWADMPRLGQLQVYGEIAVAVNLDRAVAPADPVLLGRDQRGLGFYVAATQELTRHAKVGVRFEQYEPNADALELFDGVTVITRRRFRTLTSGAAVNLPAAGGASARVLAEYEYQRNSLGRDNRGRPAQLDNDTVRVRFEVVF